MGKRQIVAPSAMLDQFERLAGVVETRTGVPLRWMRSKSRLPAVSAARQQLMLQLREQRWTLSEIGRHLGGRHHTTVMFGLRQARERRTTQYSTHVDSTRQLSTTCWPATTSGCDGLGKAVS